MTAPVVGDSRGFSRREAAPGPASLGASACNRRLRAGHTRNPGDSVNRGNTDILARLAEANPVPVRALQDGSEPAWVGALLERILDEPVDEPTRPPRRDPRGAPPHRARGRSCRCRRGCRPGGRLPRRRGQRSGPGGGGRGRPEGARWCLPRRHADHDQGVGRSCDTAVDGDLGRSEWSSQPHPVYGVTSRGGRGRLVGETVGRRDGRLDSVTYATPPGGAAFPASGEPAAQTPRVYVLALLRSGNVKNKQQIKFAGRGAWRFTIVRSQVPGRGVAVRRRARR